MSAYGGLSRVRLIRPVTAPFPGAPRRAIIEPMFDAACDLSPDLARRFEQAAARVFRLSLLHEGGPLAGAARSLT